MSKTVMKVELVVEVTDEDIDDIVCGALEGGCNYWCDRVDVEGEYLGEFASDQISRGGMLWLYDFEAEEKYMLDKEKFLKGVEMYIKNPTADNILEQIDGVMKLDTCNADAYVCDAIIQYALFGEVIYG